MNVRVGSKADFRRDLRPRPLSVEKQTLDTAMSAFGGKADSIQHGLSGPLLARSGHRLSSQLELQAEPHEFSLHFEAVACVTCPRGFINRPEVNT